MQEHLFRFGAALMLALVLFAVCLVGFGFLCAAVYLALASEMSPPMAALLTASALLLLAALTGLIGGLLLRRKPPPATDPVKLAVAAGEALAGSTDAWLRGLGPRGLAVALAAGFAIGFSPKLRQALARLLSGNKR